MLTDAVATERGQDILIIGINYWPEPTGSAPYTTRIAERLASQGAAVTVLTGMPYYPEWSIPSDYQRRLRSTEVRNGVQIRRYRTYIPSSQTAARRTLFEAGFFANALSQNGLHRPDFILGFDPSLGGPVLSYLLARRWRIPYGIIVQDLVSGAVAQTGISGGTRLERVTRALEGKALREATGVAVVAEGFRQPIVAMGVSPERIHRIRNWTHIDKPTLDRTAARKHLGLPNNAWVCLHAGNMGLKQGLENLVDTAALATRSNDPSLFVFIGDGNQRQMLQDRAHNLPNVRFLPPQPESDFPNALAAADVLLVNQKPAVTDMCLPGKLTSYFAASRPVIAAVHSDSETAHELRRAKAGLIVPAGEPASLLHAIDHLRANPATGQDLARNALHFAETELSEPVAFAAIDRFVNDIAAARRGTLASPTVIPAEGD
jgi:glycosyltransferase involved in cell wall biosynthesis